VVSSLALEHVVKPTTLVPDQGTDLSTFTNRTPPLKSDFMPQVPLIGFTLPSIFW
jgi:hypothetical protein